MLHICNADYAFTLRLDFELADLVHHSEKLPHLTCVRRLSHVGDTLLSCQGPHCENLHFGGTEGEGEGGQGSERQGAECSSRAAGGIAGELVASYIEPWFASIRSSLGPACKRECVCGPGGVCGCVGV